MMPWAIGIGGAVIYTPAQGIRGMVMERKGDEASRVGKGEDIREILKRWNVLDDIKRELLSEE